MTAEAAEENKKLLAAIKTALKVLRDDSEIEIKERITAIIVLEKYVTEAEKKQ